MNFKIVFLVFLLAFLPSVGAVHGIKLTVPSYSLSLEPQTSLNAVYNISNASGQRVCFTVSANTNQDQLDTFLASPQFCLNNNEQTEITLTVIAKEGIPSGEYTAQLKVTHDLGTETHDLPVSVGKTPAISFSAGSQNQSCNTKNITIPITVKNNSDSVQNAELEADAPGFVPSLEKTTLQVNAGESKTIDLTIHTNPTTQPGTFYYLFSNKIGNQHSIQKFSFNVKHCEPEPEIRTAFELDVPTECMNIAPGKERNADFSITNTGNQPLTIWFSVESSDLDIKLEEEDKSPVTLEAEQGVRIPVSIKVSSGISQGIHHVKVSASTLYSKQTQNMCVITNKPFSLDLFPNSVMAEAGESFGVALTLENNWNVSQSVSLNAIELDSNTHVSFSRTSVSLGRYETKTVIATVRTDANSAEGLYSVRFKASNSNAIETRLLYFTIVPPVVGPIEPEQPPKEPTEGVLEFLSYPVSIDLNAGESKEVVFVVGNDSNQTVSGIRIRLEGLPSNIAFIAPARFNLDANQVANVRGMLVADSEINSGNFSLKLVASNPDFKATKRVQLHVLGIEKAGQQKSRLQTLITGLVSFASGNFWIGLIILVLVIGWLIWGKNRFVTGLVVLIILLVLLAVWLAWGGNPFWYAMVLFLLLFAWFIVSWSRDHATYQLHKQKWKQVARSQ